jgi:hypothetical protein
MRAIASLAADAVVVLHLGYVLFVVLGLVLVLLGYLRRWEWVRNVWFRSLHLSAIAVVVLEAWLGIPCPLTLLENWLRRQAGAAERTGSFVGELAHDLLFVQAAPWTFTVAYTVFGFGVLVAWLLVPPRWRTKAATRARAGGDLAQ